MLNLSCDLESGLPWVNHEIAVSDSALATLINKWMNVDEFRRPDGDGEFIPMTADMNSIRVSIVEDLKALAEQEKTDG